MPRPLRISLIILLALVLLLGGAMLLAESQWARHQLESRVSQRLDGRQVEVGTLDIDWGFPLGVTLEDVQVDNPDWAGHDHMLTLERLELGLDVGALLQGNLALEQLALQQPVVHLARREDGTTNWAALKSDEPKKDRSIIQPQAIQVGDGRLTYEDARLDLQVQADYATSAGDDGQRRIEVEGQGRWRGRPLAFTAVGDPPGEALAEDAPYALQAEGELGQLRARFEGQTRDLLKLEALDGQLSLSAPASAELPEAMRPSALRIPGFELQAHLTRREQRWALQDVDLRSGEARLNGALVYEQGETPRFDLRLDANQLDLDRWGVTALLESEPEPDAAPPPPSAEQPLASARERLAGLLEPLRRYRGEVDVDIGRLAYGGTALDDLVLQGRLDEGRLRIERLGLGQGEGQLTVEAGLDLRSQPLTGSLDARIEQIDLGQALAPFGYPELGTLDGRLQASLTEQALQLRDTRLRYDAPAQALSLAVNARTEGVDGLQVEGHGSRHEIPFRFDLALGPLPQLFAAGKPYPVAGTLASRDTRFEIEGSLSEPLELAAADLRFTLEGPDPSRLSPLLGRELPTFGAYRAEGHLLWEAPLLRVQNLQATFGDSDVSGDVRLRLQGQPMLWATLHSRRLALADLRQTPGKLITDKDPQDADLFPDKPWKLEGLRRFDADVVYRADTLVARRIPLQGVELTLSLEQGRLTLDPMTLGIGGGSASGQLTLDARQDPLTARVGLTLQGVNLSPLLRSADLPQVARDTAGTLGGKVDLQGTGGSMDALMASLDGKLELAVSRGRLDWLAVELLGLDAGESLLRLLGDQEQVPMQCGYARLEADDGLARLAQFFVATSDSNFTGGGRIDLAAERLDLQIEAHPKDPSLFSSDSPIRLQGTLGDPQVSLASGELLASGVASVVGALVAPPLAILPWVELGLGEGAGIGCRKALEAFEQEAERD